MTRLLFWIALVILVVMAVRSKVRAALARAQHGGMQGGAHGGVHGAGPMPGMGAGAGPGVGARADYGRVEDASERMTSCTRCGIYFPASEAVREGGRDYCCAAHARQQAADMPGA
ncbi:hypothetical protein HH212_11540 [Massilia forsythiae]|uniref:Deaminase n=1 Tax=Massilia forsythiae TaxID=2728020 RepID=A0A7Z2VX67_9BURK|nr:PP0621 family protein [Massilia forsythiae]QJE00575.1 hypothetical protein HH212_11540 [Massilia forsythiae]